MATAPHDWAPGAPGVWRNCVPKEVVVNADTNIVVGEAQHQAGDVLLLQGPTAIELENMGYVTITNWDATEQYNSAEALAHRKKTNPNFKPGGVHHEHGQLKFKPADDSGLEMNISAQRQQQAQEAMSVDIDHETLQSLKQNAEPENGDA